MRRKLVLDVDTGTDDAVAIMLAALHPGLELLGCTTVSGNCELEFTTDNTLRVLDRIGRGDVPVHEGLAAPIVRRDLPVPRSVRDRAVDLHGRTLPLPPARSAKARARAVDFLIETFDAASEPVTLVAVAPLGNLAAAIALHPPFVRRVPELVVMGGGHAIGNVTPAAEFNVWADPEAAAAVFAAGFEKVTLVPLDATHRAPVSSARCAELAALGTPAGEAAAALIDHRIRGHDATQPMATAATAPVHDALCVAYLVAPAVIATERLHVAVETRGELTLGRTVIDLQRRGVDAPNADVALDADPDLFFEVLRAAFAGPGSIP